MTAPCTLRVDADHPAFAGHFPGNPILPGVVLLDAAVHAASAAVTARHWQIVTAKFHNVVRPGERLTLEMEALSEGLVRFSIRSPTQLVASGSLRPGVREPRHGE